MVAQQKPSDSICIYYPCIYMIGSVVPLVLHYFFNQFFFANISKQIYTISLTEELNPVSQLLIKAHLTLPVAPHTPHRKLQPPKLSVFLPCSLSHLLLSQYLSTETCSYFSHHTCQSPHRDTQQHNCYSYIT